MTAQTTSSGPSAPQIPQVGTAVWAEAVQALVAQAVGVDGSAEAIAQTPTGVVAYQPVTTSVAASGGISGVASSSLKATATTVGDDSTSDTSTARATGDAAAPSGAVTTGLNLSGGATSIGSGTQVTGSADLKATAAATATKGDATAEAAGLDTAGINLIGQSVTAGDFANIQATAAVSLAANAATTEGDASATASDPGLFPNTIAISGNISSAIDIGSDAQISAQATHNAAATATTVQGSINVSTYAATAVVSSGNVIGVSLGDPSIAFLGSLAAGDGLLLNAAANSSQSATAQSVGTADAATTGNGSYASTAGGNAILGITNGQIDVGGSSSQIASSATLAANSAARSVAGHSQALTAGGAYVVGANATDLTIGEDINTISFSADTNLVAKSSSSQGWAESSVDSPYVAALYNISPNKNVFNIGDDVNLFTAIANNNVSSQASAIKTVADPSLGADSQARSYINAYTFGLSKTDVQVGGDGKLIGASNSNLASQAQIVSAGDPALVAAKSDVSLQAYGIDNPGGLSLQIGNNGQIQANVNTGLSSTASSVESASTPADPTTALVSLLQSGLAMGVDPGKVQIGNVGSIIGESAVGGLYVPGQGVKDPLLAQAVSVSDATLSRFDNASNSLLTSYGISGQDNVTADEIYAGASKGDISGKSQLAANVMSTNVGLQSDPTKESKAFAGDAAHLIGGVGILQADLYAGNKGTNLISGQSSVDVSLQSQSTHGHSTSSGFIGSGGILSDNLTIAPPVTSLASLAGNVKAQSQLAATSLAQTVHGNSDADLSTIGVGLSGYDITISKSGALDSTSLNSASSKAISVAGSV